MSVVAPESRKGHVLRMIQQRMRSVTLLRAEAKSFEDSVTVAQNEVRRLINFVYSDPDLLMHSLVDLSAIDRGPEHEKARFLVFYRLASPTFAYRLTIESPLPAIDPLVSSLCDLFTGARWLERELYEMFGIYPDGHPDLRPLLLYKGFSGHPLRRDYRKDKDQPLVARGRFAPPLVVGGAP